MMGVLLVGPGQIHAQWTEPLGRGWTSLTLYRQSTTEFFSPTGDVSTYLLDGEAQATSLFLTTDVGLGGGVDAWVQLSYQQLMFRDLTVVRRSSGPGDLRLFARWSPSSALGWSVPVAVRAGLKVAVGDFDAFSSILPLGDGQTDFEVIGEVGHSFWPLDAYVTAWAGYRWRRAQASTGFDFGDERFFRLAGGWTSGRLGARFALAGLFGTDPGQTGVGTASQARRLLRVSPSVTASAGPGIIELGVRLPLLGRNLPAGPDLSLGYFMTWGRPR